MSDEKQVQSEDNSPTLDTKPVEPKQEAAARLDSSDVALLQRQREADQKEMASMREHMNILLGEAKTAKAAKAEAEQEKLKKSGEWKQLHDSQEKKTNAALEELSKFKQQISAKEVYNEALKAAATIADGHNVDMLAEQLEKRLKFVDGQVRVLDKPNGELTVHTLKELADSFAIDEKYKSLVRGNQSRGGSAIGGSSGTVASNEMTRADFDNLSQKDRMAIAAKHIKIIN